MDVLRQPEGSNAERSGSAGCSSSSAQPRQGQACVRYVGLSALESCFGRCLLASEKQEAATLGCALLLVTDASRVPLVSLQLRSWRSSQHTGSVLSWLQVTEITLSVPCGQDMVLEATNDTDLEEKLRNCKLFSVFFFCCWGQRVPQLLWSRGHFSCQQVQVAENRATGLSEKG